jgi:hypothetical protein
MSIDIVVTLTKTDSPLVRDSNIKPTAQRGLAAYSPTLAQLGVRHTTNKTDN